MWYQIKSYLKFLWRSSNQHGVHSPFVYDLVTNCFYDKKKYPQYKVLAAYNKNLLQASELITVSDFGSGSRIFKSDIRKVTSIAKYAGIGRKRQELLFRIAVYFKAETSLELGTSLGMATAALALGSPSGIVITVEGCAQTAKIAQRQFDRFQIKNTALRTERFEDFFTATSIEYDLVYLDGNHSREKTLQYFEHLIKSVKNNTVLILDDIYWSSEMTVAWNELISHPKVSLSIDTFQWGFLFFRKEQPKEHFCIRL